MKTTIYPNKKVLIKQSCNKPLFYIAGAIILSGCLLLFPLQKAQAHEAQKPETNTITKGSLTPVSLILPTETKKYTEILKPPVTVHMRSGLVQLLPGEDVGLHSTKQNEEMLVILEGQGEVEMEGYSTLAVKGGQTAYVPPETRHNVRNTGSVPLKYIFIVSKATNE